MTTTVPLNKLILSPRNVRKSNGDEDIPSLAESIASKGLLQNLVVSESATGKGFFEVDAGGRRWRALQLLVEQKRLQRNYPVPVVLVPRDDAAEASLAENLQKVAMNPADEVEAFQAIIERYADNGVVDRADQVANLARRFGRTVNYVEQRLRLAALAPEILAALREGRITIEAAKAYAGHPDQAQQLKIFAAEEKKGSWGHSPKAIQDAIAGKIYPLDHIAVRYVGLDAYRAAGGRVEADLFLGEGEREVILDPAIVDKLCAEKAADEAQRLAQAGGWLDGVVKPWSGPYWADPKAPKNHERVWNATTKLQGEQRADAILWFKLAEDGSGLEPMEHAYRPIATSTAAPSAHQRETEEERDARLRKAAIERKALRLAMPTVAGTPFEGRMSWPHATSWISPVDRDAEGNFVVAVLVTIAKDEVSAVLEEAEWQLAEEEAREAQAKSAAEAVEEIASTIAELVEPAELEEAEA